MPHLLHSRIYIYISIIWCAHCARGPARLSFTGAVRLQGRSVGFTAVPPGRSPRNGPRPRLRGSARDPNAEWGSSKGAETERAGRVGWQEDIDVLGAFGAWKWAFELTIYLEVDDFLKSATACPPNGGRFGGKTSAGHAKHSGELFSHSVEAEHVQEQATRSQRIPTRFVRIPSFSLVEWSGIRFGL